MRKKSILSLVFALCIGTVAASATPDGDVSINRFKAERHGNYLSVDVNMALDELDVESNRVVLLTPKLVNGADSLSLPSVAVYGRRRYYYYKRNEGETMLSGPDETAFLAKKKPESMDYHQIVPWAGWLDGADFVLDRHDYGCCGAVVEKDRLVIGRYHEEFFPRLVYIQTDAPREKRRVLEGRSYIDFPVDQTVIYPDYRRNAEELNVIRTTIDAVLNDKDAIIDTVWLKGYASPESPYSHNADLAKGRTEAVKNHIRKMYDFDDALIITDYEPEDWEGLRKAVVASVLEHKSEILELIDGDLEPDAKEWKIKNTYPSEYRYMLNNFYPALRHTDYRVSYVIRSYSDPKEILEVLAKAPQNLSQTEFYIAAAQYEPGSDEFTEVFETAVRMYPDDEIANLNAANAAMRRGDNAGAERYLRKAGSSPEAVYARGALAIRTGDLGTARKLLSEAAGAGLEQAAETLAELEERNQFTN